MNLYEKKKGERVLVKRLDEDLVELHKKMVKDLAQIQHLKIDAKVAQDPSEFKMIEVKIWKIMSQNEIDRSVFFHELRTRHNLWNVDMAVAEGYEIVQVADERNDLPDFIKQLLGL